MRLGLFAGRVPDVVVNRATLRSSHNPHLVVEDKGGVEVAAYPLGCGGLTSPGGAGGGVPYVVVVVCAISSSHNPHLVVEDKGGVASACYPLGCCGLLGPGSSVGGVPDVVAVVSCHATASIIGIISSDKPHLVVEDKGGGRLAPYPLGCDGLTSPGGAGGGVPDVVDTGDTRIS